MSSTRIAIALFLAASLLYLATLTAFYSPDGMSFTMLIDAGDTGNPLWFQAEHLLYPTVGAAWAGIWELLGARPHVSLQVLNALAGAATVTFLFLGLAALLPRHRAAAVVGALGLAVSYGHWLHATDVEDQMLANALVALAFWLLAELLQREETSTRSRWLLTPHGVLCVGMGLAQAGAVLIHMTAVLWTIPALVALLWTRRGRPLVAYLVALAAATGLPYLLIGAIRFGYFLPGDYVNWFLSAPGHGVWGRLSVGNVWTAVRTLVEAFVYQQGGVRFSDLLRGQLDAANLLAVAGFAAVVGLVVALGGYVVLTLLRPSDPGERRATTVLAIWAVVHALFNAYWAPEDVQFWTVVLLPLWGMAALLVARSQKLEAGPEPPTPHRASGIVQSALIFLLIALFVVNLGTAFWPRQDPANNAGLQAALCVGQHTDPADLIVTPGWDWASSYGPYFAGRRVLSLVDTVLIAAEGDTARGLQLVDAAIADTWQAGGRVYVVRLFSLSDTDRAWLQETAGLSPKTISSFYRIQSAFTCRDEMICELLGRSDLYKNLDWLFQ